MNGFIAPTSDYVEICRRGRLVFGLDTVSLGFLNLSGTWDGSARHRNSIGTGEPVADVMHLDRGARPTWSWTAGRRSRRRILIGRERLASEWLSALQRGLGADFNILDHVDRPHAQHDLVLGDQDVRPAGCNMSGHGRCAFLSTSSIDGRALH